MWRFSLAGLSTVGGLVLLFVASFGYPETILRDLRSASTTEQSPIMPQATQAAPVPNAPVGSPDTNGSQPQRDALRQLHDLKASLAQAMQDSATLRQQAEQARREIEDLRQQRATDEAALEQARLVAQRDAEERRQRAAEAEKQNTAALATPQPSQHVGPPADVKPTADVKPPVEIRVDAKSVPPSRPAVAAPSVPTPVPPSVKPPPAEPDARETVLTRLRREVPSRGGAAQVALDAPRQVAPDPPRTASPRQRLMDARTALAAGRTDEAQHLLEQAQVQLVLRPVSPSQDAPVGGSVAAGQVAEALSMLGAGDLLHAIRYINLAVAQADQAPALATVAPVPIGGVPQPQRTGNDYNFGR